MSHTGQKYLCLLLARWRCSKILPDRGKTVIMSSVAHVSGQRRAVVRSSISTLAGENGRSLHTEAGRRTPCVESPPVIAKPKSTVVDEEDLGDAKADGNAVGKRRQSAIGKRVVVGMSGGVDSSVAAMLLQRQGFQVVGAFMRNWDSRDEAGGEVCTADVDLEDARRVGHHLGIPVETVDFSREYWHEVFAPSMEEFAQCRTPNMDVACNRFIKFDAFMEHALVRLGADLVATGHYARLRPGPGGKRERPELVQAVDDNKDQTYFLCGVPSWALAKVLFPLGGLSKPEVRELAAQAGLPVARKRESMGVCFVGKRKSWAEFISQYISPTPGNFVCVDTGKVMGQHRGVQLYTIGQKSHLGGMDDKYYVAGLDAETNSVIVARGASNPTLYARGLSCLSSEFRWVAGAPPAELLPPAFPPDPVDHVVETAANSSARGGLDNAPLPPPGNDGHGGIAGEGGDAREPRRGRLRCTCRCRHRQELMPCTVELLRARRASGFPQRETRYRVPEKIVAASGVCSVVDDFSNDDHATAARDGLATSEGAVSTAAALVVLRFDDPAKAVAPGQVVALYRDGVCLGGGPILRAEGHCAPVLVRPPPQPSPPPVPRQSRRTRRNRRA